MRQQISDHQSAAKHSSKQADRQPNYTISPASHGRYIIHISGMRYIFDTEIGTRGMTTRRS